MGVNATPFGVVDKHFGMDVGFWVFTYPFIRFVSGFMFAVLFIAWSSIWSSTISTAGFGCSPARTG